MTPPSLSHTTPNAPASPSGFTSNIPQRSDPFLPPASLRFPVGSPRFTLPALQGSALPPPKSWELTSRRPKPTRALRRTWGGPPPPHPHPARAPGRTGKTDRKAGVQLRGLSRRGTVCTCERMSGHSCGSAHWDTRDGRGGSKEETANGGRAERDSSHLTSPSQVSRGMCVCLCVFVTRGNSLSTSHPASLMARGLTLLLWDL